TKLNCAFWPARAGTPRRDTPNATNTVTRVRPIGPPSLRTAHRYADVEGCSLGSRDTVKEKIALSSDVRRHLPAEALEQVESARARVHHLRQFRVAPAPHRLRRRVAAGRGA